MVDELTISKMKNLYFFSKTGTKFTLFSKIGSDISNILSMSDELSIRVKINESNENVQIVDQISLIYQI